MGKPKARYFCIKGIGLIEIIFSIFGFLIAASLGSFYVTLTERILIYFYGKKRKSFSSKEKWKIILFSSSHCEVCSSKISFYYLIPIFGYFLTKGECHHCKSKISPFYPWSELLFGIWFLSLFFITQRFFFSIFSTFLFGHVFLSMLTDLKKFILDYENLFFIGIFYFLSSIFFEQTGIEKNNILVGIGFLCVFGLIYKLFPNQIGFADILYVTCYAFFLGHPLWMVFLNTSYISAVGVYFVKKITKQRAERAIPMGFYFGLSFLLSYIIKILEFLL